MTRRRGDAPPLPKQHRDGSRTWTQRAVEEQLAWIDEAFGELRRVAEGVIRRAVSDFNDGTGSAGDVKVAGGSYDEDGDATSRVQRLALRHAAGGVDPVAVSATRLMGHVIGLRRHMLGALTEARFLKGLDPEEARRLVEERKPSKLGAGVCANPHCRAVVTGARDDRLRAGRCEPCYRYRKSHGGEERPAHLCHPESVPPSASVAALADLAIHDAPRPSFWRDLHATSEAER